MKIAMMAAWNSDSGAAIHAELIGRAWAEKGIELKVFSFYQHSFHGKVFTKDTKKEEPYVIRCFTKYGEARSEMDSVPILEADYDIFIVEDLGMLPIRQFLNLYPEIKRKAKTVNVIHDGAISEKSGFFDFKWDRVICFDERYFNFLKNVYTEKQLKIIPYPALPWNPGKKIESRRKLGLPIDKKIVFCFGQAAEYNVDIVHVIEGLSGRYDITMLVVTGLKEIRDKFKAVQVKNNADLKIINEVMGIEKLYDYLYAADCFIYNKPSKDVIVVSSAVYQCMGSGCPIIARDSNFVDCFNGQVIKYATDTELVSNIIDVFDKGPKCRAQRQAVRKHLKHYSAEHIADQYIELFEELFGK
ncbi:MAG: hypothetical protein ABH869_00340 [Candidatus Omnitrophota bacterium]